MRRRAAWIFVERVHHACGVDERCPGVDGNGDTQRFCDLFLGCTILDCGFGMNRNAAVTTCRDGDRKRMSSGIFATKSVFRPAAVSTMVSLIVSGLIWATSCTVERQLFPVCVPVEHHVSILLYLSARRASSSG